MGQVSSAGVSQERGAFPEHLALVIAACGQGGVGMVPVDVSALFPVILDATAAGIGRKLNLKPPKVCVCSRQSGIREIPGIFPSVNEWRSRGGKGCWGTSWLQQVSVSLSVLKSCHEDPEESLKIPQVSSGESPVLVSGCSSSPLWK